MTSRLALYENRNRGSFDANTDVSGRQEVPNQLVWERRAGMKDRTKGQVDHFTDFEDDYEDEVNNLENEPVFEKIRHPARPRLPVSSKRHAQRTAKKTLGSKRVKKSISQKTGGMHRRRQRTIR
jgi:hypothetical protein